MTETTIPTLYYTLNKDYTRDKAYKTLKNRKIFDLSFCADTIYSPKYKTAVAWVSQITASILGKGEDDLFILCNSELSFVRHITNEDICRSIIEAGQKGAQILLGNIDTARDLYCINKNLLWTDLFYHTSFIVIYKSVFKHIAKLTKQKEIYDLYLEQAFTSIIDYKFVAYPFLTTNRDTHIGMNNNQTWYDNSTSHYYEGLEQQVKTFNEKLKQFPFERTKGYSFD